MLPAPMKTEAGEIARMDGLLLLSVTVTPPAGAGVPNVTGKSTVALKPTFRLDGRVMLPGAVTVTVSVALGIFGVAVLAVMVVEPGATGVTITVTLLWFAGIVTDGGTVAAPELDELKLKVTLVGAGTESVSERLCGPVPLTIVAGDGAKLTEPLTGTLALAGA